MTSVSDVLSRATLRTREARICLDGELLGRIDDLGDRIRRARQDDMLSGESLADTAPILVAEKAGLLRQADEQATVFGLRAVPGAVLDNLKREYPPSEGQWQFYRSEAAASPLTARAPEFDYDQVLPRLVGLTVITVDGVEVSWSETDGIALWEGLSDGARADLAGAVWEVNNKSSARPTSGTGIEQTPTSGPVSTTPANGASPTPSSPEGL